MADMPKDIYSPETQNRSGGYSVLIVTDDKVEDLEFFYPYYRFIEAGFEVDVATPDGKDFAGKHGIGLKQSMKLADVRAEGYDLLYLPGGKAPAKLKDNDSALMLVKRFVDSGKPVAAICHGPQILAAANVIQGRKIAAWPEVKDEIEKAGGIYVNAEANTDGQFITGRWPGDLPLFMKRTLETLQQPKQSMKQMPKAVA
jgi:protease I